MNKEAKKLNEAIVEEFITAKTSIYYFPMFHEANSETFIELLLKEHDPQLLCFCASGAVKLHCATFFFFFLPSTPKRS